MKKLDIRKAMTTKTSMMISGIVCAIPFIFGKAALLSLVGFLAPAYVFLTHTDTLRRAMGKACLFGFFYFLVGYSFLCELYPLDFVGIGNLQSLGIILFAMVAVPLIHGSFYALSFGVCYAAVSKLKSPFWSVCAFGCSAVFSEAMQMIGELAFPWCRVAVAQAAYPALVQSVSVFGSYFIAFLVPVCSALVAVSCLRLSRRTQILALGLAAVLFVSNALYGVWRITSTEKAVADHPEKTFVACALQGNIPSAVKWNSQAEDPLAVYQTLWEQTQQDLLSETKPVLYVMPETAFTVKLDGDNRYTRAVQNFVDTADATFIAAGFSAHDHQSGNSLFLFTPHTDHNRLPVYTKQHLVPFGEHLPYRAFCETFLPFLTDMNALATDLYAGTEATVFDTAVGKIGATICYESIFPDLCRKSVENGAEVLVVSTNDSWFGTSKALTHHLMQARLRAIENGVSVVRCANTGISALIKPNGRFEQILTSSVRGTLVGTVSATTMSTPYRFFKESWLYVCMTYVVFCGLTNVKKKFLCPKKAKKGHEFQ